MAGGKQTPRQKMINLMYLIFIAMLALNMSKEVLSAFGLMNEKLIESNIAATERNTAFLAGLAEKASEQPEKYRPLKEKGDQISSLAEGFNNYLEGLKSKMTEDTEDIKDYETMDKGDFLDNNFFKGDIIKPEGKAFLSEMKKFREGVVSVLAGDPSFKNISDDVIKNFNTDKVTNRDGVSVEWLDYHYKGFPLVASLTKMTQIQADIKTTESNVLSAMLQGELNKQVSFNNYTTLMESPKSAYFNGEQFDGQIVLGRKDNSTKPTRVELTLDGRKLGENQFTIEEGRVKLKVGTGAVGEHKIEGNLIFAEGGKEIEVPVKSSFVTVAKPKSATISADKMNVVYRGVKNPMTISFAGVSDNNVSATAQGLTRVKGSQYMLDPSRIKGREVTINVTGKLPDGAAPAKDSRKFRIKDLPRPTGAVSRQSGAIKMQRNGLEIATISAEFEQFAFDLPLTVNGFSFKVQGQPTVKVRGSKLDGRAKSALRKARRGSTVYIRDIEVKAKGVNIKLKKVSPVLIELTN